MIAALGVVSCRPPAPAEPGWIERDASAIHAVAPPRAVATAARLVAPAQIDELDEAGARAALDGLGDRAPAGKIALRLARLLHHRGDDPEARALLARAARAGDAGEVAAAAAALDRALVVATVDPAVIAVLLPLSGPHAGLGSELRAAVDLAPAAGTSWLYLDTRGTPDGACIIGEGISGKRSGTMR